MSVILEQRFPLGRFHATRWRESIFEDKHGEWPPSPWRLLRALAARWIQYSRESGDENIKNRDDLLRELASEIPAFHLPDLSWRPETVPRQYHRTGVEWTAKGKKDSAYKKPTASLVPDRFQAVPVVTPVYWYWESVTVSPELYHLLYELTRRITYFGRTESYCQFRLLKEPPEKAANCFIDGDAKKGQPVLVPSPEKELDLDSLLAATDAREVLGMTTPPTAAWRYAQLPKEPSVRSRTRPPTKVITDQNFVQFAVGGRVYPTLEHWVRVTERFRGRVLKNIATHLMGDKKAGFVELSVSDRERFSGISGKDGTGKPLADHSHAFFALYPDESGYPTRLLCYRATPFLPDEINALHAASDRPMSWRGALDARKNDDWKLRMVPLPFETLPPVGFDMNTPSTHWESITPYVPQGGRHRFRKNGRLRPGETPERLLEKLLDSHGLPRRDIERLTGSPEWLVVHESAEQRKTRRQRSTRNIRQGYRFRIRFHEPHASPIFLGHSSHFGLGMFLPVRTQS